MPTSNNTHDQRPMSPHLQIYDLPLTAKLSILHRITGTMLFIGLILMIWVLAVAANGAESWQGMQAFLSSWFGKTILFGFTFALYYHLCSGIRHLLWDIGKGLTLEDSQRSNLIVLIVCTILTFLTWFISQVSI